jgi:ATP-dependent RNA helicase DeaD
MKFNELQIKEEIIKAIEEMGFSELMPIQERVIPFVLDGCDVIGQAQTGTGKTAAFGIPLIEKSSRKHTGVEHLIISPTRELATQIKNELELLAKYSGVTIGLILGGVDYNKERRMLKANPNIIVGTPGRLLDHITNKKLDLSNLKSLTLDEADEMLDIGFKEELNKIIEAMPEERQSLLFSATLSEDVKKLASKMLNNPIEVLVSSGLTTATNVKQQAVVCEEEDKLTILTRLLQINKPQSAIIFGRTKRRADELAKALLKAGFQAKALHGDLTQKERSNVMDGFKSGLFKILVATDVAARGIHVDGIEVVYNFDLPQEIEYYVHRIGRTGRAGMQGTSISFVRSIEMDYIELIEKKTRSEIEIIHAPSNTNVKRAKKEHLIETIKNVIEEGRGMKHYDTAVTLIEMFGAEMALNAALEIISPKNQPVLDVLSKEPPVIVKLRKRNEFVRGKKHPVNKREEQVRFDKNKRSFQRNSKVERKKSYSK